MSLQPRKRIVVSLIFSFKVEDFRKTFYNNNTIVIDHWQINIFAAMGPTGVIHHILTRNLIEKHFLFLFFLDRRLYVMCHLLCFAIVWIIYCIGWCFSWLLVPNFLIAVSTSRSDNARRSFLFFELVISEFPLRLTCWFLSRARFQLLESVVLRVPQQITFFSTIYIF
jgi:hypothetical protein